MGVEFPAPLRDDCVREDLPFVIDEDDLCSVEEDRLPRGKKEFSHQKLEISKFEGVSLDPVSRSIGNRISTSKYKYLGGCLGKGTEEERVGVVGVFCP